MEFSWTWFGWLAPFIFFGGFVDAMAGGGGLITVPAYLAAGVPTSLVLGTNKLSSSIGTLVSTYNYYRRVPVALGKLLPLILATILAAACGARAVMWVEPQWVRTMMLLAIPCVAFLVYKNKKFGHADHSNQYSRKQLLCRLMGIAMVVGFYDGFFGPGTGTFLALGFSRIAKFDLLKSTAYAKYINLTSNIAALATFLYGGVVHVSLGLALGIFGIAGHYMGSRMAIKHGPQLIRPMIVLVLCGLLFKVAYDTF